VIPFHAQGTGDRAMEELIGDGLFQGVIDIVPAGVEKNSWEETRSRSKSLETAGRMGIPNSSPHVVLICSAVAH